MNRNRGGNHRGGGNRGGGRHSAARGQPPQSKFQWVVRGPDGAGTHTVDASSGAGSSETGRKIYEKTSVDGVTKKFDNMLSSEYPSEPNSESHTVDAGTHTVDASSGAGSSETGRKIYEKTSVDGVTKKFDNMLSSEYPSEPNSESHGSFNVSPNYGNFEGVQNVPETGPKPLKVTHTGPCYDNHIPSSPKNSELNEGSMIIQSRKKDVENCSPSHFIPTFPETVDCQFSPKVQSGKDKLDNSDSQHDGFFDICEDRSSSVPKLKDSLFKKNKELRKERGRLQGDKIKIIRPGMILLKGYISPADQVKLVKSCRELGKRPGGFYQPGFRDGAKLHLKMMCLGKNWDPETSRYGDTRPVDQAKPPPITDEFKWLVEEAIQKCHHHLESERKGTNVRDIIPLMSPDICIINFYTKTGNLGLHKDKDESTKSLQEGLPVVSISLGDTAEFLFGDEKDVDKADPIELESGDVLIFGGKSRHIFHGVRKIIADTAPRDLLEKTHLKPGRLNLTFRKE